MKKFALGSFLATLAMFVWGPVFWANPAPYKLMEHTNDDAAVGRALLEHFPQSGTYLIPGQHNDQAKIAALSRTGPFATIHFQREGREPMPPSVFIFGFLQELVTVVLIGCLLQWVLPVVGTYGARVRFVAFAGLIASFYTNASRPIWWHHPWNFYLLSLVFDFVSWLIVGLILAKFIQPAPTAKRTE